MIELTKSEKRKCRELIQLGLNRECAKFVEQIRNLSQTTSEDPQAQYIAIYRKTRTFDKHVILIRDIPLMMVLSLSILFFGINLRSLDV